MDNIAEKLERLAALREKGALTEEEFQKQKQVLLGGDQKPSKRFYKKWWFRLSVGIVGLIVLIGALADVGASKTIPTCESRDAETAVKNAIESSVTNKVLNVKLLSLTNQTQSSFNETRSERICRATALLNTGQENITYRFFTTKKGDHKYFVEVMPE